MLALRRAAICAWSGDSSQFCSSAPAFLASPPARPLGSASIALGARRSTRWPSAGGRQMSPFSGRSLSGLSERTTEKTVGQGLPMTLFLRAAAMPDSTIYICELRTVWREIRTTAPKSAPHRTITSKSAPAVSVPHQRDLVENAILCSLGYGGL